MNKIKTFMLLALTALAVASCSKDDLPGSSGNVTPEGRGIYLSFSDGADTRSTLQSSEVDYKDVDRVFLYVFNGNTADAPCIHSQDIGWVNEDKDKNVEELISQSFWISYDVPEGDITFLAVGVDDRAGDVYGFNDTHDESLTLGTLMAKLAAGKGKDDMAHAQFFSGYVSQKVGPDDDVVNVEITLRRKVAGVLAYLGNIPYKVTYNGSECRVEELRISLHCDQHTQFQLWKDTEKDIYGEGSLEDSNILYRKTFAEDAPHDDRIYLFDAIDTDKLKTKENTLLTGVYLLPIDNQTEEQTIKVELYGTYITGEGIPQPNTLLKSYTITSQSEDEEGTPTTAFPIHENYLYSIGKKLSDASTDGDKPADLSGNILQVNVVKWCEVKVDHTFPSVQGPARFEGIEYNANNYIFDAPGTSFEIIITPPSPLNQWNLKIDYQTGDGYDENAVHEGWIHFRQKDAEGKYPEEYVSTVSDPNGNSQVIEVTLNDFAVKRPEYNTTNSAFPYETIDETTLDKIANDYRTAILTLTTEGSEKPVTYRIRQYNTITVGANSTDVRGAARLDYGCYFDPETGKAVDPEDDTHLIQWGYRGWFPVSILGPGHDGSMNRSNGESSAQLAEKDYFGYGLFSSSAMGKLWAPITDKPDTPDLHWYLPAEQELDALTHHLETDNELAAECLTVFNMKTGDKYWYAACPPAGDGDRNDAYYIEIGTEFNVMEPTMADKNSYFRARPIRKFETE